MSKWTEDDRRAVRWSVTGREDGSGPQSDALCDRILDLEAELAEQAALSDRLADILKRTAIALKGEPEPLSSHSWHDLPEVAAATRAVVKAAIALWDGAVVVPGDASVSSHALNDFGQTVDAYRAQREGK